jgi:DNA-binding IclR family transcriptional regulator
MTPHSITSPARLRARLERIRAAGLSLDECESNEAVFCVAAPIYDHTGDMVAAMSISTPSLRWNDERRVEWSELIRRGAAELSQRLGHRPPVP